MASKANVTRTIHRSSVTGRLVKETYAKSHPRTTETERIKVPAPTNKPK